MVNTIFGDLAASVAPGFAGPFAADRFQHFNTLRWAPSRRSPRSPLTATASRASTATVPGHGDDEPAPGQLLVPGKGLCMGSIWAGVMYWWSADFANAVGPGGRGGCPR